MQQQDNLSLLRILRLGCNEFKAEIHCSLLAKFLSNSDCFWAESDEIWTFFAVASIISPLGRQARLASLCSAAVTFFFFFFFVLF